MCYLSSSCFLCLNNIKNQKTESVLFNNLENTSVKQIKYVLPEIATLECEVALHICLACREALNAFYTYKMMCLESYCRLKYFIQGQSNEAFVQLQIDLIDSEDVIKQEIENDTDSVDVKEESFECDVRESQQLYQQLLLNNQENTNQNISTESVLSTSEHNATEDLKCVICNIKFAEETYLQRHMKIHNQTKDFVCRICNKEFTLSTTLKQHVMNHLDTKKLENTINDLVCSICDKKFNELIPFQQHMKIHKASKKHKCKLCNKSFTRNNNLLRHVKRHTGTKEFSCSICKKLFSTHSNLLIHGKQHIKSVNNCICTICHQRFLTFSILKSHMTIHMDFEELQCLICNIQFSKASILELHMQRHAKIKDFKCLMCNKTFSKKLLLRKHMEFHLTEKKL